MSAGETPGIRDACPMVDGLIRVSFCRASIESAFNELKSKSGRIEIFSSRTILSAMCRSRSMYP